MPSASPYGSSADELWPKSEYPDRDEASGEGGLRERVVDVAGRVGEGVSEAVGGVRERASELSHAAGAGLIGPAIRCAMPAALSAIAPEPRVGALPGRAKVMRHGLDTLIEDQPLVAGAIAMALGAAVGGALPRSRMEDQMFGEQSDRAMEAARTLAKEQGAKVQATAGAVMDEAMNIAGEAAGGTWGETALGGRDRRFSGGQGPRGGKPAARGKRDRHQRGGERSSRWLGSAVALRP